jgi:hypothetical protein
MKPRYFVAACGLITLLTMSACDRDFVVYEPLKLQTRAENKLVPAPELNTPDHLDRIKTVLNFYDAKWQTNSSGKLLVTRRLSNDEELLWNYTKKAEDPKFIENARAQKK